MYVPSTSRRAADVALLVGLTADPLPAGAVLLDGRQPAYLVTDGEADLYTVRRTGFPFPQPVVDGTFLTRIDPGTVLLSSTVLGAWQLALVPLPGTGIRPIRARRLRRLGYGGPADLWEQDDPMVPPPRAVPALTAALARAIDTGLIAVANALRPPEPPPDAAPLADAQLVSLATGAAITGDHQVTWLRVAGGHIRRNNDEAALFGGPEPALLAGQDWIVADGPCTVEAVHTTDLLVAGQLPGAIDHHTVLTLRTIERRQAQGDPIGTPRSWPPPNCPKCTSQ